MRRWNIARAMTCVAARPAAAAGTAGGGGATAGGGGARGDAGAMLAWLSAVAKQGPLGSFCAAGFARQGLLAGGGGSFALVAVGLSGGLGFRLGSDVSELSTEPSDHLRELSTQVVRLASGLSMEPG